MAPAAMEMFWDDTPMEGDTGRDQRIADGLEVAALNGGDDHMSDASDQELDYYNPQTKKSASGRSKKRKLRVEGGVAPTAKKIEANYDSDDGRIIELKQLGYSDEYVSNKVIEEGRIRYVPKTIGSRYLRLRKALEEAEDNKLDDELTDWHVGEDEQMAKVQKSLQPRLERQIEALRVKFWKEVSAFLAGQLGGKKKYTHRACRARADAIIAGTELAPIELDPDQEGRRKMREERIKNAKAARIAAEKEAIELETRKKSKTLERKRAIAEANQKKVSFQLKKIAEKKERLRIRDERIANRDRAKKCRLLTLNHMRIERDWEMEKNRKEKQIYQRIMGVDFNGKPVGRSGRKKDAHDSDEESEAIDDLESDEEEANFTDDEDADDADVESEDENIDPFLEDSLLDDEGMLIDTEANGAAPAHAPAVKDRSKRKRKSTLAKGNKKVKTPKTRSTKKVSTGKKRSPSKRIPAVPISEGGKATVTEDTLLSPRSIMTRAELETLCFARGIPRRPAAEESHPELVARLHAIDESLPRPELDDLLRQATESTQGNKIVKIQRLQTYDASHSIAAGMGLESHDLDFMRSYEGFAGKFKSLIDDAEHTAARQHKPGGSSAAVSGYADW